MAALDVAALRERALDAHRAGKLDDAEALYRALLDADPRHAEAHHLLGVIAGQRHDYAAAVEAIERSLAIAPDNASALNNLGNALRALGRGDDAIEAYGRSLTLNPTNLRCLLNRAAALMADKRFAEAEADYDAALALDAALAAAYAGRGDARLAQRRTDDAAADYRAAIGHGGDAERMLFALAAAGHGAAPSMPPSAYVRELFDGYADHFDRDLVQTLQYRTPWELLDTLRPSLPEAPLAIVDLGCGTGLCGELLRPHASRLVGVDLSPKMLAHAEARGCYDALHCEDLVGWLETMPGEFDLAVAADVLNYLGDLRAALVAAHTALRPGGQLAFSVETAESAPADGYELGPARRYRHRPAHVGELAAAAGFEVRAERASVLRHDRGEPVAGTLFVVRKRSATA